MITKSIKNNKELKQKLNKKRMKRKAIKINNKNKKEKLKKKRIISKPKVNKFKVTKAKQLRKNQIKLKILCKHLTLFYKVANKVMNLNTENELNKIKFYFLIIYINFLLKKNITKIAGKLKAHTCNLSYF